METTIYDRSGNPIAYISVNDENAIYLWDGHAVCYIDEERIYGWRGKHIGWFINNIIYDASGYRIGFTKETCPCITYIEPIKNIKYVQSVKYVQYVQYVKPILSLSYSKKPLKEFLEQNRV